MMKKVLIATVAIFVAWEILDFLIHGVLLQSSYAAQPELWRPEAEMKMGLLFVVTLISAFCFSYIYGNMITNKSTATAVKYSLFWGIAAGVAFGYGSYAVLPVPYSMALTWFLGTVVEAVVAGVLVGLIIKEG